MEPNSNYNFIDRYNERNEKIKRLYNRLICPEILKLLGNYGITTITGVASIAMIGVAVLEPDLFPEEYIKEILGTMTIGGAVSGLFSLEFFMETKEKRQKRYANIQNLIEKKNRGYYICQCDEPTMDTSITNESTGKLSR